MTRRDAVASVALFAELLASARDAHAQTQPGPTTPPGSTRPPVFKHDLPNLTMDDWEVTVSYVDYAPGRVGAAVRLRVPQGGCRMQQPQERAWATRRRPERA